MGPEFLAAVFVGAVALGCGDSSNGTSNASSDTGGSATTTAAGSGGISTAGGSGGIANTGGSSQIGGTLAGNGGSSTGADGGLGASACSLGSIAWYLGNIGTANAADGTDDGTPTAVAKKTPNAYGLYDMLGNAPEWTQDCYHSTYSGAPTDGSAWLTDCDASGNYVSRGGCSGETAAFVRASARGSTPKSGYGGCKTGVRCVTTSSSPSPKATWASIPAGMFKMGCSSDDTNCSADEKPAHSVTVAAFKMMATEVTNLLYWGEGTTFPDLPAAGPVQYDDAKTFCESLGARLPTEAEWEYAARGGTTTALYCSQ